MIKHSKIALLIFSGFALGAFISICLQVQAGSLTPSGTPASTSIGVVPIADIVGSGYVTSTDSLHQNALALTNISIDANSMTSNAGMYNNHIISMNPPAAYTEVCFKSGATYYDARSAGAATGGGNCSVGDVGYVIETNERGAQTWELAKIACTQINMRLPEPLEWKYSCKNAATWSLSTMTTNWEWASNSAIPMYRGDGWYGVGTVEFGAGGCAYGRWGWVGWEGSAEGSYNFRCVR